MIRFSNIHFPTTMRRGSVFSARQYPRQAFADLIDPVLNVDWFEMNGPTFPPHPHAGFSAVTYLFADSPNGFVNRDSFGDVADIRPGGLHWSRASEGMMHEEMPIAGAGPVHGLQIFINLPADAQNDPAAAFAVHPEDVRVRSGAGWTSRVAVDGTTLSHIADALPAPVRIEEIKLDRDTGHGVDVPSGWGGILIVLDGELRVGSVDLTFGQAIGFATEGDACLAISTGDMPTRLAMVSGQRLHQPIVAGGPLMTASTKLLDRARRRVSTLAIPV